MEFNTAHLGRVPFGDDRQRHRRATGALWSAAWFLAILLAAGACSGPAEITAGESRDPGWERLSAPEDIPKNRPLRAAFLVVDGVYNTELTAPYDLLQHSIYQVQPGIETYTVSPDGEAVTTAEGLVLQPDHSFATAPRPDILVVPSAEHSRDTDLEDRVMVAWVAETGRQARFVVSLCWGAFVLAEAGLLDGRAATTFPRDYDLFEERYPEVGVRRGPSFVHDGPALTSVGGAKSFDVAMYLLDHLYGETVARKVGAGLLIPWPPEPGTLEVEVVPPRR